MKESLGIYDYWAYDQRPKITWPGGAKVAFWVAPNIEYYELDPPPNPSRKPWPHPHPSVPGYSIRDYGNRVGHQRQMTLLDKYGIRGSVSLSTALCEHHPEIIQMGRERDWEFFSHGIYNLRRRCTAPRPSEPIADSLHQRAGTSGKLQAPKRLPLLRPHESSRRLR